MNVWKLVPHHGSPYEAAEWATEHGRIAVGWGRIGDLRALGPTGASEITEAIANAYPDIPNAHLGGPSLWNFYALMQPGDLVLVTARGQRLHVAEITGPYMWMAEVDAFEGYQHQRAAVVVDDDPDDVWTAVGNRVAAGHNARWTVALCLASSDTWPALGERYSEGSRFDIVATAIERNPKARQACIKHHGTVCAACGFDFAARFGRLGDGFIHVHHLSPLGTSVGPRSIDPVVDLIPLCPNCHAMVHRRRPPLSVEGLRAHMLGGA